MFAFPAKKLYQAERVSEAYAGTEQDNMGLDEFGRKPRDVLISLKALAMNATFVCVTIAGTMEYSLIVGLAVFLPKIIQFQFAQTPAMSAVWAGKL